MCVYKAYPNIRRPRADSKGERCQRRHYKQQWEKQKEEASRRDKKARCKTKQGKIGKKKARCKSKKLAGRSKQQEQEQEQEARGKREKKARDGRRTHVVKKMKKHKQGYNKYNISYNII